MQAKISEIFTSYQGEGTFMGSRQVFIRFYGCNLNCSYCDTVQESYRSFTKESLMGKILDIKEDYNELVLTGGEPLLHADFLAGFLPLYKKNSRKKVYLETNGTLPLGMAKAAEWVDIVAMDIKLPSSTGINKDLWLLHSEFLAQCAGKETLVKAVITDATTIEDIKQLAGLLKSSGREMPVILQVVTNGDGEGKSPDEEMLFFFKEYIKKETLLKPVVLGQMHKCMGMK
ncbi:MAG: 7-carboxy-7-deazaguanine synthase QueE [Candidatus Omnitrophota bacterium]